MYFEIFKEGKLVKRGTEILNNLSWEVELMDVPQLDLTLPIEYLDYLSGREEIKIYANDKIFWGIVWDIKVDKTSETIDLDIFHIVREWEYRQISVNNAIKDKRVNVIFKGSETASNGFTHVSANPLNIYTTEVSSFTPAKYIERAGAVAWDASNGNRLPVSVNSSAVEAEEGDYDVVFSSGKASVTVKANVKKKNEDGDDYPDVGDPSVVDQLEDIYADTNFAYPGWVMNYSGGAASRMIDYVYSRQNKLEALEKTCELTPDLFWRVDFSGEKRIDVGVFGDKKPFFISKRPRGETNIPIIDEPTIDYDFENVFNIATVYTEKGDSGMSSTTLREVYNNPSYQLNGFPVVILRSNVNNERNYSMYSTTYPKLAPNNELEYCVIDEESIALEGGNVIEETFAANDLAPFNTDSEKVTDADRIKASRTAYEVAVRKLKQARRSYKIEVSTEELPPTILVGDKVRFVYDNSILKLEACSNYMKKIMSMDDWYYITRISYDINDMGVEVDTLVLEKQLKIDRETKDL